MNSDTCKVNHRPMKVEEATTKNDFDSLISLSYELKNKLNIENVKTTISEDFFDFTEENFNIPNKSNFKKETKDSHLMKEEIELFQNEHAKFEKVINNNLNLESRKEYFDITEEVIEKFTKLKISDSKHVEHANKLENLNIKSKKEIESKNENELNSEKDLLKKLGNTSKFKNKKLESYIYSSNILHKDLDYDNCNSKIQHRKVEIEKRDPEIENSDFSVKNKGTKVHNIKSTKYHEPLKEENIHTFKSKTLKIENKHFEDKNTQIKEEKFLVENYFEKANESSGNNEEIQTENKVLKKEMKLEEKHKEKDQNTVKLQIEEEIFKILNNVKKENELFKNNDSTQSENKVLNKESGKFETQYDVAAKNQNTGIIKENKEIETENLKCKSEININEKTHSSKGNEKLESEKLSSRENLIGNSNKDTLQLRERAPIPSSRKNSAHLVNHNYIKRNDSDAYAERLRYLSGCNFTCINEPFQIENSISFVSNEIPKVDLEFGSTICSFDNVSSTNFTLEDESITDLNSPESGYSTSFSLTNSPPRPLTPINNLDSFSEDFDEDAFLSCLVEWQSESPPRLSCNIDESYKENLLDFFEDLNAYQTSKIINQDYPFSVIFPNINLNDDKTSLSEFNSDSIHELPIKLSDIINLGEKTPSYSFVKEMTVPNVPLVTKDNASESIISNDELISDILTSFSDNNESIPDLPLTLCSNNDKGFMPRVLNKYISNTTSYIPEFSSSMSSRFAFPNETGVVPLTSSTGTKIINPEFFDFTSSKFDLANKTSLLPSTSSSTKTVNVECTSSKFDFLNEANLLPPTLPDIKTTYAPNIRVINLNTDISESAFLAETQGSSQLPIECKPLKNTKKDEFRRSLSYAKCHSVQAEIYHRIQQAQLNEEEVKIIYIPDENNRMSENQTNLHLAVLNKKLEEIYCIVEIQKQYRLPFSDFSLRDRHGKTPLDYAIQKKMDLVAYYLEENNACRSITI